MRIRIVGAGALGLLFTSKIITTKAQVELITRAYSMTSRNDAVDLLEPVDWLFLMVKQKDVTQSLLKQLLLLATEETRVLCFQNGIGHMEVLKQGFPVNRLYAAVTTESALKISEHTFRHTGRGTTWFGRIEETNDCADWDEQEINLQSMLIEAGFEVFLSKKIINNIWNKLLINAVINPLTAIFQIKNGVLLESVYMQELMRALFEEGCLAAGYAKVEIADNLWEQLVQVCEGTAENQSSMLKDIIEGRATEIDWINGALLQYANKNKLVLPTHQTVYRMVKYLESR